ncbi:MAG: ankyrin repeat domain-containing protein [Paracoccaceae bacterium]|nr:ankyrin repeat domain-containing protein [Paracoccaceae bacterium]
MTGGTGLPSTVCCIGRSKIITVRILLEHGVDVNALDHNHNTPLHSAVYHAEPGVVTTLYEAGADPDARNRHGETVSAIARSMKTSRQTIMRARDEG